MTNERIDMMCQRACLQFGLPISECVQDEISLFLDMERSGHIVVKAHPLNISLTNAGSFSWLGDMFVYNIPVNSVHLTKKGYEAWQNGEFYS